ncbi:MAG: hypothetical protein KAI95_14370, partial [Bacteroidales bacterium]|nr:hypothetical protein [Bacteroidales bacterium]
GGYGWKARFVGTDGHLIGTAGSSFGDAGIGHNQINFYGGEDLGWEHLPKGVLVVKAAMVLEVITSEVQAKKILTRSMNLPIRTML